MQVKAKDKAKELAQEAAEAATLKITVWAKQEFMFTKHYLIVEETMRLAR
jgi:hypothetical protein